MEKRRKNRSAQAEYQVKRLRRLYSQIGQPLPVDVIIDLHRHLPKALELAGEGGCRPLRRAKKACKYPN